MPGENIYDWSITAANNATADTLINWAEGQPRSSVNNSARSMMAALAKARDLMTGAITTGGSANAQTLTSGIGYTVMPASIRVLLKIGATNTGAATLNMDGISDIAIKDQAGLALVGGELKLGSYAELRYDGTNWILLNLASGTGGGGGKLALVSTTALSYLPYNGSTLRINGILYDIPTAGLAGLANTGVYVNGVAAQNLAVNTTYFVYAFNSSGTITADFSTTSHATSSTTGNVGTEIKTADDTRSLIGMIRTNASSQFVDSAAQRFVRSWFNKRSISGFKSISSQFFTGSATYAEINSTIRVEFLAWLGENVNLSVAGLTYTPSGAPQSTDLNLGLNSTTALGSAVYCRILENNISYGSAVNAGATPIVTEGYNYATGLFASQAGGQIYMQAGTAVSILVI